MNSNLILPVILVSALAAAAFVFGRLRVNDFVPRRDLPVLGAAASIAVLAIAFVAAPAPIALIGPPVALTTAGALLLASLRRTRPEEHSPRPAILVAAAGAVILGIFGLVMAMGRLP